MSENENEKMPTRGIRMPDELWKTCIEMSKELGYGYPSDFIRDAIEFFIEWNNRKSFGILALQRENQPPDIPRMSVHFLLDFRENDVVTVIGKESV